MPPSELYHQAIEKGKAAVADLDKLREDRELQPRSSLDMTSSMIPSRDSRQGWWRLYVCWLRAKSVGKLINTERGIYYETFKYTSKI